MLEFEILRSLFERNHDLPDWVTIPPGDDMAGISVTALGTAGSNQSGELLVAVDQIVDGIHINTEVFGLDTAARKLVMRNLSDVAAMGGEPLAGVLSVCAPKRWDQQKCQLFLNSVRQWAEHWGCPVIGGDISIAETSMVASFTVLARSHVSGAITRTGAMPGDMIYVSGKLGGGWHEDGSGPHLSAEPRLGFIQSLLNTGIKPNAMIDLSDGLAGDLQHVLNASGVSAKLDVSKLPIRREAIDASDHSGKPPWIHAVCDGEDYELLMCVSPDTVIPDMIDGLCLSEVGEIVCNPGGANAEILWSDPDTWAEFSGKAWEHGGD